MANENILKYEPKIWNTADLLIGAGIKQSDFPKYMMPFFALIMVESRLIREAMKLAQEYGVKSPADLDEESLKGFIEEFEDSGLGYNDFVIRENKRLTDICENDKTFSIDFDSYLKSFDKETKGLLGVEKGNEEEKFLDISGVSGLLKKKKILFSTVKAWSEIDLLPFDNSEITTLEEHIKRKWADISADTAGEQYTPNDIIALISEIVLSKIEDGNKFLTIYDPTCGGGNMLFGVEDRISKKFQRPIKTFGEDWNDTLYALAKIESRFREDSDIRYGNTLTKIHFIDKEFDVIVANPPYGIPWKGYQKDIKNDKTGRFVDLPPISDGQMVFDQHILHHLDEKGIAVVVNNGSALFTGDAGGGESNIRKYFFDSDYVEAIIQLPSEEFFNTDIYTYLWIFNKNKPKSKKDKVALINASGLYKLLKKKKGKKRKKISSDDINTIVQSLNNFKDDSITKVFDKWHFYYNKNIIRLKNIDYQGRTFESQLPLEKKLVKIAPDKIEAIIANKIKNITPQSVNTFDQKKHLSLYEYFQQLKVDLEGFNHKESKLKIHKGQFVYYYDNEKQSIIRKEGNVIEELGCGKILVKATYVKPTKNKKALIKLHVELTPHYDKDFEIIKYSHKDSLNRKYIADFMEKNIFKPFDYLENIIGVQVNFYKEYHRASKPKCINKIYREISSLQNELNTLKDEIKLEKAINDGVLFNGLNELDFKPSGIEWIDRIPKNWDVKRAKDLFFEVKDKTETGKEELLSVSEYFGVGKKQDKIEKDEYISRADSLIGYKKCRKDDLVINIMLAWKKGLGVSQYDGIVSPAYAVFRYKQKVNPRYFHYLFRTELYTSEFKRNSTGIIDSRLRLYPDSFFAIPVIIPPLSDQNRIVDFLDEKTNKINKINDNIQKQTSILTELNKTLIETISIGSL